jgi:hypothetical protein
MAETALFGRRFVRVVAFVVLALGVSTLFGCGRFTFTKDLQKDKEKETQEKLVGTWVAWSDGKTEVLTLRADGTFLYVLGGKAIADFSGKWVVSGQNLDLTVEKLVVGDRKRIGNRLQWSLDKIETNTLILGGASKSTTYTRQPDFKTDPDAKPSEDAKQPEGKTPEPKPQPEIKMPEPKMPEPTPSETEQ